MKAFLFFLGSAIRGLALNPKNFLYFHSYIIFVYFLAYLTQSSSRGFGFIFILSVFAPLLFAISKGLPLDCLDYESAIKREQANSG